MVQLLGDPTLSPSGTPTHELVEGPLAGRPVLGRTDSMTREDHAQRMKELNLKRGMMRVPRRGWSLTDYQGDNEHSHHSASSQADRQAAIPEDSTLPNASVAEASQRHVKIETSQVPPRPKLPAPRRSYSVMDYEPFPPGQPVPSKEHNILDLPSELHYAIFDFLDPIDSVCFGLTNSNFYDIHRRMHGKVPLSSRYSGPNDREWAWRGATPLVHRLKTARAEHDAVKDMQVKGQVYCRKCGISRCELHRHLKDWMGDGYEYCSIKDTYDKPAGADAKPYCFMKSPKNPHRCGRHGTRKAVK